MKRKRKRKQQRQLLMVLAALLILVIAIAAIVSVSIFACRSRQAQPAVAATAEPTDVPVTPAPTATAAPTASPVPTATPPIADAWYTERTEAIERYVRAYSGLTDENEIQARVAGMAIDPTQKMVAFTFDDGPRDELTDAVLDVCEQYNVRVTFFIKGDYIAGHEAQLKRMLALGCEIGNHTWDHTDVETLTAEEMRQQIESVNNKLIELFGYAPKSFRPPYISYGAKGSDTRNTLIAIMQANGMAVINHTRSTHDTYDEYTADMIYERMIAPSDEGHALHYSIILCHDKTNKTINAFRRAVPVLLEQGYQLVTVYEMLSCSPDGFHAGWIYSKAD